MATIRGNSNSNKLTGTNLADKIFGYAGKDNLSGRAGDDLIYGGDVIRFLDLITGDIRLMPHSFGEMLNHSEQTAKGVEIEFKTGNVLLLMGVDMDDLSRSNFEFSFN
jgi:Ca2+-binding RTX toxin-like protein